tara:strand:- start:1199 stop:1738 length:540 start_codon:yes stop_codon:yes gene_type:complete
VIFLIGGIPCSGKSTLMRNLLSRLPEEPNLIEPKKLFKCQEHGDILVVGQYPEGETFGGTDKLSHGSIPHFREFIEEVTTRYKHTLIEGDRYFRNEDIEWLLDNHEAKVIILTVPIEIEHERHHSRGDTQSEVWLQGRRTQIDNIRKNFNLMDRLIIHDNYNIEQSMKIEDYIYGQIIR